MERIPNTFEDVNTFRMFEHIFNNAMGLPVNLPAAPTKKDDMQANTIGYFSNTLYIKFGNGEIKSLTLTPVV